MTKEPISKIPAESWENEGGSVDGESYAESLGVTRRLTQTYIVGGYSYTSLADAVAQGRRRRKQGEGQ